MGCLKLVIALRPIFERFPAQAMTEPPPRPDSDRAEQQPRYKRDENDENDGESIHEIVARPHIHEERARIDADVPGFLRQHDGERLRRPGDAVLLQVHGLAEDDLPVLLPPRRAGISADLDPLVERLLALRAGVVDQQLAGAKIQRELPAAVGELPRACLRGRQFPRLCGDDADIGRKYGMGGMILTQRRGGAEGEFDRSIVSNCG